MARKSLLLLLGLGLLVGLSAAGRLEEGGSDVGRKGKHWRPPKWYRGKDGPIFDIVQSGDDYEQRRYYASLWATTNITNSKFDDAWKAGTERLDDYWGGHNTPKAKLADTVPTFVMLYPSGTNRSLQARYTVEYFLPHELHENPPAPAAKEVNVINVPDQDVWVRVFGGYAREDEVVKQAFGFIDDLKAAGEEIIPDFMGLATYDDPLRVVNRHNEIWVWPKQQPSAKAQKRRFKAHGN